MTKFIRLATALAIALQGVIAIVSASKDNDVSMFIAAFTAAILLIALIGGEMQKKKKPDRKER